MASRRENCWRLCLSLGLSGTLTPVIGPEVLEIIRITVCFSMSFVETTEVLK